MDTNPMTRAAWLRERGACAARRLARERGVRDWAIAQGMARCADGTPRNDPAVVANAAAVLLEALAGHGGPMGLGAVRVLVEGDCAVGGNAATGWHPNWPETTLGSGRRNAVDGDAYRAAIRAVLAGWDARLELSDLGESIVVFIGEGEGAWSAFVNGAAQDALDFARGARSALGPNVAGVAIIIDDDYIVVVDD